LKPKWTPEKSAFFASFIEELRKMPNWNASDLESRFKGMAEENKIKAGDLLLPLRIMLVGEKKGPPVFDIAAILGAEETIGRMESMLGML
ncbi:MAG: glutamate--tRNA ligase, partial [Chitinophagales bacterium]